MRPLRFLVLATTLMFPSTAWCQQSEDAVNRSADFREQTLERHGIIIPRPADPERREAWGFPPPREPRVILEEIDELDRRMRPIAAQDDVWKERYLEYRRMQRERGSLISELEESGYDGPRLEGLVRIKLEDIRHIWDRNRFPVTSYDLLRAEVERRFANEPLGREARWWRTLEQIHLITGAGFHVAPRDYERIAQIDREMPDPDVAGILLLEALKYADDESIEKQWHDWMIANLDPETHGYRAVMRRRMFGSPIRLTGEGLDGKVLDTADWRGDVVLVDFWGMWCVPCKEAMPHLKELYEKYADRGLRIAGVLSDHEIDKAIRYLDENDFDWPQFTDRSLTPDKFDHPIAEKYAVGAYPTLWIIDRNGVLREEADRSRLEEQVLQYLDESPTSAPEDDDPG